MDSCTETLLITGATGSIGSRLAQSVSRDGRHVKALVHNPGRAGALSQLENVDLIQGDLEKPDGLRGCMDECSLVYHFAAKLTGSDWERFNAINVVGTRALLKEAARAGVRRFIHASTIGVYACSEAQNIGEDVPWPKNTNPYFTTKQEAEKAVWEAMSEVPAVVARLGDVFGPGQYVWTIDFIDKVNHGKLLPPLRTESGNFNPVYIDNAVDALMLMGRHPAAVGQAFNIVDGTPMPFCDYIRWIAQAAGKPVFAVPSIVLRAGASMFMAFDLLRGAEAVIKPGDVDYLLHKGTISGEKIRSLLGWSPAVSQEEAFRRTEEWLRSEGYIGRGAGGMHG